MGTFRNHEGDLGVVVQSRAFREASHVPFMSQCSHQSPGGFLTLPDPALRKLSDPPGSVCHEGSSGTEFVGEPVGATTKCFTRGKLEIQCQFQPALFILGASRRPPTPNFSIFPVFRGFRSVFRVFRGRGWSGRVREPIFMPRNRFFIIKSSFEKVKKSSFYTIEKWS